MQDFAENVRVALNEGYYTRMQKRVASMRRFNFGTSISVLLITDRLEGCAEGLKLYLKKSTDIAVELVINDPGRAIQILHESPIDFLIVVGYLENKDNYDAIRIFDYFNRYSQAIIYAPVDEVIAAKSYPYEIIYAYDMFSPVDNLITYMRRLYDQATQCMHEEISPKATRAQVRIDAIEKLEAFKRSPKSVFWDCVYFFKRLFNWLELKR